MSDKKTKEQELFDGMAKSLEEIEVLMKSYAPMSKDEQDPAPGEQPAEQADGLEQQAAAAEAPSEAPAEEAPSEEAPAEAAPAEEAPAEGEEDHEAEMAADIAELSDEELGKMLEMLMAEHERRSAHEEQAPNAAAAPEAAPAPGMDEMKQSLEMSMKEEFKKLEKSQKDTTEKLQKSLDAATKELAAMKKKAALPVQKAASTSAVKTVDKAPAEVAKLSKSETTDYLLGQMRNGNKNVKADMVALVNTTKNEEELAYAHDQLKIQGIELPKK